MLKSQALLGIRIVSFKLSPVDCRIFILCLVMSSYSVSNVIILSVVYIHTVLCECVELKEQLQSLALRKTLWLINHIFRLSQLQQSDQGMLPNRLVYMYSEEREASHQHSNCKYSLKLNLCHAHKRNATEVTKTWLK